MFSTGPWHASHVEHSSGEHPPSTQAVFVSIAPDRATVAQEPVGNKVSLGAAPSCFCIFCPHDPLPPIQAFYPEQYILDIPVSTREGLLNHGGDEEKMPMVSLSTLLSRWNEAQLNYFLGIQVEIQPGQEGKE